MARKVAVQSGARGSAAADSATVGGTYLDRVMEDTSHLAGKALTAPEDGTVRYLSKIDNLHLTITAPPVRIDPATGYNINPPAIEAKFRGGIYETGDPVIIKFLDKHPRNGLGMNFWRAEKQGEYYRGRSAAQAANILESTDFTKLSPAQLESLKSAAESALAAINETAF